MHYSVKSNSQKMKLAESKARCIWKYSGFGSFTNCCWQWHMIGRDRIEVTPSFMQNNYTTFSIMLDH